MRKKQDKPNIKIDKAAVLELAPPENIKFIGRPREVNGKDELVPTEPLTAIYGAEGEIKLPPPEKQLAGAFYHEAANLIVSSYPWLYKHYTEKG